MVGETMKRDKKRVPGFYWVRFEGEIVVAEFTDGRGCSDERPHWHIPGSAECFRDREICELLSGKLATIQPTEGRDPKEPSSVDAS